MNEQQIYTVRYWDTHKIFKTYTNSAKAIAACRGLGHTGKDDSMLKGYPPIAYVSTDEGAGEGIWYNPRFKKEN